MGKMHFSIIFIFLFSFCFGCANPHKIDVTILDPLHDRQPYPFLEKIISSPTVEDSRNLLYFNYRTDSRTGFDNVIGHTNYLNAQWPEHGHTVSANFYASWSSLYLLDGRDIMGIGGFANYDRYITRFFQAQWYAKQVLSKAKSGHDNIFKAGRQLVSLTDAGRMNSHILHAFLKARHIMDIEAHKRRDRRVFEASLREFKELQRRHPQWLPQLVQEHIDELEKNLR
jgi:hypothetical protein